MAVEPKRGRAVGSRFLAALAYGDFQTLWTANFFAGAAAWALIVARGWIVYEFSDSSLWVGVVTFAAMVPRVVVSPFTGYLSDRFDRRTVLRAMFALNALHNLVLGWLMLSGSAEIWHIVVLSFVNGSARAAQMPAGQALIPNLVPRELLLNAIALNQATMHGSRLLGPLAIIPLLATTGTTGAIFLCAGFYLISLVQTMRLRTASTGRIDQRQSFIRNFSEGAVYVYKTPMLFSIVVMAIFHCGLVMSFESMLPVLSTKLLESEGGGTFFVGLTSLLNESGAGFSVLMMAVGAGALTSAIILAGIKNDLTKGRLFFIFGVFSGLSSFALGLSPNLATALPSAIIMGVSTAAFMTLTHTMIQTIVPDGVRGRVGAIYSVHIGGMMASMNALNAWLSDILVGVPVLMNVFGGALSSYLGAPLVLIVTGLAFAIIVQLSSLFMTMRTIYGGRVASLAQAPA